MKPDLESCLVEWTDAVGVSLTSKDAALLIRYAEAILYENTTTNLTRITELGAVLRLHIVDSLAALSELEQTPDGPVVDLGTGAGFPGVPLALVSHRRFLLLDSVGKKTRAVRRALQQIGQTENIDVLTERAETLALERPNGFAAVTTRAVSSLASLVELSSPLLSMGGMLIALKGRLESPERELGASAARLVGMEETAVRVLQLPGGDESRTIVTFEKHGDPEITLPRRAGMAQRHPIGS